MKNQKLDEMTRSQRAAFARRYYGRLALPKTAATRFLLRRLAAGEAK